MINVSEVVVNFYSYYRGETSLEQFRAWMVGAQLELDTAAESDPAHELVWLFEARFAELSDGIIDEPLFKNLLKIVADGQPSGTYANVVVQINKPPASMGESWGGGNGATTSFSRELQYV